VYGCLSSRGRFENKRWREPTCLLSVPRGRMEKADEDPAVWWFPSYSGTAHVKLLLPPVQKNKQDGEICCVRIGIRSELWKDAWGVKTSWDRHAGNLELSGTIFENTSEVAVWGRGLIKRSMSYGLWHKVQRLGVGLYNLSISAARFPHHNNDWTPLYLTITRQTSLDVKKSVSLQKA
jgi:hypothetical protein